MRSGASEVSAINHVAVLVADMFGELVDSLYSHVALHFRGAVKPNRRCGLYIMFSTS